MSNFCNKIFRGFRSTEVKIAVFIGTIVIFFVFPLTLLVIVTTVTIILSVYYYHTLRGGRASTQWLMTEINVKKLSF